MDAQQALKALFEQGGVVLKDGRTVKIEKLSLTTLGPALALVTQVVEGLGFDVAKGIDTAALLNNPLGILKLISKHYTETLELVTMLVDLPKNETLALDAADGLKVVHGVYIVNHDFFMNEVVPALRSVGIGQTQEVAAT